MFVGCEFPADDRYRVELQHAGERVAEALRDRGVLGRFVVVREGGGWRPYAIEINLRKGGTTHPFLMLDFLTDGMYDRATGLYRTPAGRTRYYLATDNLHEQRYVGLSPDDLVGIAVEQELHFHAPSQEGVVFHLIGALAPHGKLGMVCIGADRERARRLYARTVSAGRAGSRLAIRCGAGVAGAGQDRDREETAGSAEGRSGGSDRTIVGPFLC